MKALSPDRIAEIDRLYRSPKERAEDINAILQIAAKELEMDHTLFDITCFCVQFLGMLATSTLSDDEDFVRIAKLSNIWLHHHHYNEAEKIHGKPDRKEK